jgi:hypothetical protein
MNILYNYNEGSINLLVRLYVGTAFYNILLKEKWEGREDEEEEVSSYRMTLRKRKCTGILKRKN